MARRRFDEDEGMNRPGPYPPPAHLDEQARAKWADVLPILAERGELDPGTLDALAVYCQAWARWTAAESKVSELGTVVKSPAGFAVPNPYLSVAKDSQRTMRQWGAELGLSPAARKRIKTKPTETAKPTPGRGLLDELLRPNETASARN
jgi:P27 family predicted phage terminase small subunit